MISKIKDLLNALASFDREIGFGVALKYALLAVLLVGVFNFKFVFKTVLEYTTSQLAEIHSAKMDVSDDYLHELNDILVELRAETRADRVLYYEYHNSLENEAGIPFKYISLVSNCQRSGVSGLKVPTDINIGLISSIYVDLRDDKLPIINKGEFDNEFDAKYPGIQGLMDGITGSQQQVYINVPGIKYPVGLITLEWYEDEERPWEEISKTAQEFGSKINALVVSTRRKLLSK